MLKKQLRDRSYNTYSDAYSNLQRLTLAIIRDEKQMILKSRKSGKIEDDIFNKLLEELDREEIRAQTLRL